VALTGYESLAKERAKSAAWPRVDAMPWFVYMPGNSRLPPSTTNTTTGMPAMGRGEKPALHPLMKGEKMYMLRTLDY